MFVGVGTGARIVSSDGVNWATYVSPPIIDGGPIPGSTTTVNGVSQTTGGTPGVAPGIVYGAGMFVEFGGSSGDKVNYILKSTNGLSWTPIYTSSMTATNHIVAASYGNSTWVFVTQNEEIITATMTSSNWNWTQFQSTFTPTAVAYGNGVFAMCAIVSYFDFESFENLNYNMILSSPDGITWQFNSSPIASSAQFFGITFGNGLFVATAYDFSLGSVVLTSSNLVNWASSVIQPTNNVYFVSSFPIAFGGNQFITSFGYYSSYTYSSPTFTSSDGLNWTTNALLPNVSAFTFGQGTFVAAGQSIYQSGVFASQTNSPFTSLSISTYPGVTIIGTAGAIYQIQSSPDLINWQTLTNFMLPYSSYIWVDTSSPVVGQKFYRSNHLQ